MKKNIIFALPLLVTFLFCSNPAFAAGITLSEVSKAVADDISTNIPSPGIAYIGGEWCVIGIARSETPACADYRREYYANLCKYLDENNGILSTRKNTEYSRVILALTALGYNPADVGGYNLLTPLGDFYATSRQGVNGSIWALIALDSKNYAIPKISDAEHQATREMYITHILSHQNADGGFSLASASEPDITAMALQSLAKYQDRSDIVQAVQNGLQYLSSIQKSTGGFASIYNTSGCETVSQVIIALCELGVPLNDGRFVKNDATLLDNLLTFRTTDGNFVSSDGIPNQMSKEQAFLALVSIDRANSGCNSIYRMDDVPEFVPFPDIASNKNRAAVSHLAAIGIINGTPDGKFNPDKTVTRAEFAAMIVKFLELEPKYSDIFSDVPKNSWYSGYVGAAAQSGIINGVGNGKFDPMAEITNEQAAVMLCRAADYLGIDTSYTYDIPINSCDIAKLSAWSKSSVAFCLNKNVLDCSEGKLNPSMPILRCETAQAIYSLLKLSKNLK